MVASRHPIRPTSPDWGVLEPVQVNRRTVTAFVAAHECSCSGTTTRGNFSIFRSLSGAGESPRSEEEQDGGAAQNLPPTIEWCLKLTNGSPRHSPRRPIRRAA